ncbi:MAG: VOC family protein [Actinocrinis sp.]
MAIAGTLIATTIDCPDPRKLATFYEALTGWDKTYEDDNYAAVSPKGGVHPGFNFQRVDAYTAPVWPEQSHPQQFHLDFYADGALDEAEAAAVALGASRAEHQPQAERWRVMLDPAGHPFCLCLKS